MSDGICYQTYFYIEAFKSAEICNLFIYLFIYVYIVDYLIPYAKKFLADRYYVLFVPSQQAKSWTWERNI
jgi:hypothetical protein